MAPNKANVAANAEAEFQRFKTKVWPALQKLRGVVSNKHSLANKIEDVEQPEPQDLIDMYHITEKYEPCLESVKKLTPTFIDELRIGIHHVGKKLTARVLTVAADWVPQGSKIQVWLGQGQRAVWLVVFNPPTNLSPLEWLPKGAIVTIKQPFLDAKQNRNGSADFYIRVDHPSDIQVEPFDAKNIIGTAAVWHKHAIGYQNDGNIPESIAWYA